MNNHDTITRKHALEAARQANTDIEELMLLCDDLTKLLAHRTDQLHDETNPIMQLKVWEFASTTFLLLGAVAAAIETVSKAYGPGHFGHHQIASMTKWYAEEVC